MDYDFDADAFAADLDNILGGQDVKPKPKRTTPTKPISPSQIQKILDRMRRGTSGQESSGSTTVVNADSGAAGQFQVMPANIPNWTQAHYGRSLSTQEFLKNPVAQRAVFNGEMGKYVRKALRQAKGNEDLAVRMASAAWYGGEGAMHRFDDPTPQYTKGHKYPSFRDYTTSVLNRTKGKNPSKDGFADFLKGLDAIIPPTIAVDNFTTGLDVSQQNESLDDFTKGLDDAFPHPADGSPLQNVQPGVTTQGNTRPIPESDNTLKAQLASAIDPRSPRAGVLYGEGQSPKLDGLDPKLYGVFKTPDGREMLINYTKARKLGLRDPAHVQTFIDKNPASVSRLIGKAEDVGNNTSGGMAVQTIDPETGAELTSSVVTTPESAQKQTAIDKEAHPHGRSRIVPTEQVVADRLAAQVTTDVNMDDPGVQKAIAEQQAQLNDNYEPSVKAELAQIAGVPTKQEEAAPRQKTYSNSAYDIPLNNKSGSFTSSYYEEIASRLSSEMNVPFDVALSVVKQYPIKYADEKGSDVTEEALAAKAKTGTLLHSDIGGSVKRQLVKAAEDVRARSAVYEAKLKEYAEKETPSVADLLARKDAGFDTANGTSIDDAITAEREAYNQSIAEKGLSGEYSDPYAAGIASGEIDPEARRNIRADLGAMNAELEAKRQKFAQDVLKDNDSFVKYRQEQERIKEEYKYRPLAEPLEFARNFGAAIPKAVAILLKTADVGVNLGVKSVLRKDLAMDETALTSIGDSIDKYLESTRNPDLKDKLYLTLLPDTLGQLGVQIAAGVLSGGATVPTLIGASQGASSQYNEAKKFNATDKQKLGAAIIGALSAVPDALLFGKWFRGANEAEQTGFFKNLTRSLMARLGVKYGDEVASDVTRNVMKEFTGRVLKNAGLEGTQEVSENKINDWLASVTYDPSETRKKKLYSINDEDITSFIGGLIGGGVGGAIESHTASLAESAQPEFFEKAQAEVERLLEKGELTPEKAAEIKETLARAAEEADKGSAKEAEIITSAPIASGSESKLNEIPESSSSSREKVLPTAEHTISETVESAPPEPPLSETTDEPQPAPKNNHGLTETEIAKQLNRFTKSGDLYKYRRKIASFSREQKIRVAENLRAGDDVETAIKDAKTFDESDLQHAANSFISSVGEASDIKGEPIEAPVTTKKPSSEAGFLTIPTGAQLKAVGRALLDVKSRDYFQRIQEPVDRMIEQHRAVRDVEFEAERLKIQTDRAMEGMSDAERTAIVDAMEHDYKGTYWDALTPEQKKIALNLKPAHDFIVNFNRKHGVFEERTQPAGTRYMYHWWNDPTTGRPFNTHYGEFAKTGPSSKQRHIETYAEGRTRATNPLDMASTNPGEILGKSLQQLVQVKEARELIDGLKTWTFTDPHGTKLKGIVKEPPKGQEDRYVELDIPALNRNQYIPQSDGTGLLVKQPVYVIKELEPKLKAYFQRPEYGKFDDVMSSLKSLKLAGSFFHGLGLLFKNNTMFRYRSIRDIKKGMAVMRGMDDTMKILHRNGLDTALERDYEDLAAASGKFHTASITGKISDVAHKNPMSKLIFGLVRVGLKNAYAHDTYGKMEPRYIERAEQQKGSPLTPVERLKAQNEAARMTVERADNLFSGEDSRMGALEASNFVTKYYFNPKAQRVWNNALISKTWQREHMLEAKNVLKSLAMPQTMGPIAREHLKQVAGVAIMMGTADLYNYFMTQWMDGEGHNLWDNPSGSRFSIRAPWNEPDGSAAYIRPFKAITEVPEVIAALWPSEHGDIVDKLSHKVHPVVQAGVNQFAFSDKHKSGMLERGKQLVEDFAPISFATPYRVVWKRDRNPWDLVPWVVGASMQKPRESKSEAMYDLIDSFRSVPDNERQERMGKVLTEMVKSKKITVEEDKKIHAAIKLNQSIDEVKLEDTSGNSFAKHWQEAWKNGDDITKKRLKGRLKVKFYKAESEDNKAVYRELYQKTFGEEIGKSQ